MTTTSTTRSTNRTTFSDGCGLASNDLTAIGLGASQRAWDAPAYADLLAFDWAKLPYASVFTCVVGDALARGVFTVGGGIVVEWTTGLESHLNPGFIGMWDESRYDRGRSFTPVREHPLHIGCHGQRRVP